MAGWLFEHAMILLALSQSSLVFFAALVMRSVPSSSYSPGESECRGGKSTT